MRLTFLTAGIAILAAAGVWQARAGREPGTNARDRSEAAGLRKHGAYLVKAAILCSDCHTPRDDRGKLDRARQLRGATLPIRPKKETKNWADEAPDITSRGLAGKWGEEGVVKFLMTGVDPHGHKARPPMPAFRLSARDARAVYLYLRSLPGAEAGAGRRQGQPEP